MLTLYGRKIYTWRYPGVDTSGVNITIPSTLPSSDIVSLQIHIEGNTVVASLSGAPFSGSAAANITSDGITKTFDVAARRGGVICNIAASSGTIDVSVIALSRM